MTTLTRSAFAALRMFALCAMALLGLAATPAFAVDLQVSSYTWAPDPVGNTGLTTFTVRITNNGPGAVSDGVLTVAVASNFNVDPAIPNAVPPGCVLGLAGSVQTLTCSNLSLSAGDTTLDYIARAAAIGSANTTASISSASASDPNSANDDLVVTPAVRNGSDLSVTKDDQLSGQPITSGGVVSYRIVVTNNGPDPTSAIRVVDQLPTTADFTYQAAGGTGWSCTYAPGGGGNQSVTCNYAGAAANGAVLPPITVTGRVVSNSAGTIQNAVAASVEDPLAADPNTANNTASVTTNVQPGADMRASKTMDAATIVVGTNVNVTLGVFNDGPLSVASATITDAIHPNFTIGTLPAGCVAAGQTVTCTAGTLASGANSTFNIPLTATAATGGSQVNTATIGLPPGVADPDLTNNTDGFSFQIVDPTADLTVASKVKTPNPVQAGAAMTSVITVRNLGPSVATYGPGAPIRVTDAVSVDETYVSNGAGWSCTPGATITCETTGSGTLAVGANLTLTLTTQAGAAVNGTVTNTACTGSTGTSLATPLDTNAANDCTGAGVYASTVTTDLTVDKEVSLSASGPWTKAPALQVAASDQSFYIRLTAQNLGASPAATVNVADTLPNSLNSGGFTTGFSQVSASSGTVSYTPSTGRISWSLTNLAGGATETAVVRIDRPMSDGSFINTATITSPDTVDTDTTNNSATAAYDVAPLADMVATGKSITPDPARVGVQATYIVSLRNAGANPASNVVLTDTIDPTRFQLVGSPTSTKGGAICSKTDATGAISCDLGTFNRNETFQVSQTVIPLFPFGGATSGFPINHTNTATVSTTTAESDATNNSASVTHGVTAPGFDLAVANQEPGAQFDPLRFGDDLVYDIRVSNFGPSRASNVVITDVPAPPPGYGMTFAGFQVNQTGATSGFTLYTPPAPNCAVVGSNVECRLDAGSAAGNFLDPLRQVIFRLRFTPTGTPPSTSLTFTNNVQVVALEQDNTTVNQADSQLANNSASQTTTVLPSADLEVVSKTRVTASPATVNQPIDYDIVIRNNGPSPIAQVRVADQLPAGFVLTGAPTATASGAASVTTISCTGVNAVACVLDGAFPPDGSLVTFRATARAAYPYSGPLATDMVNTATITPGRGPGGEELARDPVAANDSKTAAVQIAKSSIAGVVYADDNVDNVQQGGEALAGVSLTLSGTDIYGNAVSRTVTTAADGGFLFDGLPPSTGYTIVETQPAGIFDFREAAGTAGGAAPNTAFTSAANDNQITGINLPASTAATGYVFRELRAASVAGTIFSDLNNNGAIDGGEPGIAAAAFPSAPHVLLTGTDYAGQAVNLTTAVNGAGAYQFANLPPSDATGYTVTEIVQPNGFSDGLDSNGAGALVASSGGRAAPEDIVVGPVAAGAALTGRNFGELATSTLAGMVFLDPNANATRDTGENTGISGAVLRLTGTNDLGQAVDCQITTTATGLYSFPLASDPSPVCQVLRPGTYVLTETPPPGLNHSGAFIGSLGGTAGGVSGANTAAPGATNTVVTNIIVAAGSAGTRYDFGATGQGLSGYVYVDRNRNGVRDPGEAGIPGVTVTLSGTTATSQDVCTVAPSCTATTDQAGNYLFANVPGSSPAGYALTEQPQSNAPLSAYADGAEAAGKINSVANGTAGADQISAITLNAGELGVDYAFGELGGSLAGSTYIDANDDGVRQAGEAAIPGVTVTLSGTTSTGQDICTLRAALNPALTCTVVTGADGGYRFDDLPSGDYVLVETQPSQFADGREGAGAPGGVVDNTTFGGNPAQNRIASIPLTAGAQGQAYDFGERATTIHGRVYKDRNRNGADDSDPGIPGVTVVLRQGGTVVATTTTGPDGSYRFTDLPSGSYTVEETQPPGYGSSTPDTHAVNVSPGVTQGIDFGETVSSLAGLVFVDANDDGVQQPGERAIPGVTVRLTGTTAGGAPVDRTATTDAAGAYLFDDVLGGTYALTETQPVGFSDGRETAGTSGGSVGADVISAIALPPGIDATGYQFGERGQGQSGNVYVDSNMNGVRDPGEVGIGGVVIELKTPAGAVVQTTTTNTNGDYNFPDIEAGDYVIVETQPAGYGEAVEHPTDSVPFTVGVGHALVPINFGERVGSIAGLVYNDSNGDGRHDANEPVIRGVALTLSGTDARGNPVAQTAVSGEDGTYRFTDLPGGTYTVVETQPQGYQDGLDTPGSAGGAASGDSISAIALGAAQDATGYLFGEQGAGARLSGRVWFDRDHDRTYDSDEPVRAGWVVELRLGGQMIATTTTGADGSYAFSGVAPGAGYEVRFRDPATNALYGNARPNETGAAITPGVVSPTNPAGARIERGVLDSMVLSPGADVQQQSLPLDPSGVVYDSVRRTVVEGATVQISGPAGFDPNQHLLGGAGNVAQKTNAEGQYQYWLMPGAPAGVYTLAVTPPNASYNPIQPSSIIPPCVGPLTVGAQPDPMLVSTANSAPPNSAIRACTTGGATTAYFLSFVLTPGVSANVINNNIPIDPILEGAIEVTKTTPMVDVSRGGLVPYVITARNTLSGAITGITLTDRVPAGFAYRQGSATLNGQPVEPQRNGRLLSWPNQAFAAAEEKTIKLILVVGSGVGDGEHVNQAFAVNQIVDTVVSNLAEATVRLMADPDFDCTDILGKVFDDRNMNGVQDEGEPGLPGVRLASARGLLVTTDKEGRYHVTCPMIPNEDRGSNFVLKLDTRTLPTGYRMTTVNPDTVRLTRGKFAKLNFGAALSRVVRLELNGDAFDDKGVRADFETKLEGLIATLAEQPSVLRVAYAVRGEESVLVRQRLKALSDAVEERWRRKKGRYRLVIEEEPAVPAVAQKGDAQ